MTRFARAKGSKSSNERTPDDSTPWEVMKEQLLQSKKEKEEAGKRQEAENQRIANYENFLKDHKISKRKATWCDFPEEQAKKRLLPQKQSMDSNKNLQSNINVESNAAPQGHLTETKNKKKKKKKNKELNIIGESNATSQADLPETKNNKKHKIECLNINGESNVISQTNSVETMKKKKNKKKTKAVANATLGSAQNAAPVQSGEGAPDTAKKPKKKNKRKQKVNSSENTPPTDNAPEPNNAQLSPDKNLQNNNSDGGNNNKNKKKKGKMANGKAVRRKEINDKSFQLIINTKEVELVRFEGFPIMKKDAERLTELRQSMIKKGIPKSEVQRTMKLERRRAEKALARLRREVCYNCRKGGHNLSDCPELKSKIPGVDAADGICFKCGSTEHRQFECKVQRDKEFRFATCFICREPGHIARQCPDNPKGLYPNGGSCKLCGDVTHLRKDCPTTQGQREETCVKLDTLQSADNIEDIGHQPKQTNSMESEKKHLKKIKF